METLLLPFSPRFIVLTICAVVTGLLLGLGIVDRKVFDLVLIPLLIFGGLTALGIRDLMQQNHAVLRNYPISAHIRFLLEEIRPEMRQYFFESEKDGMPFSRDTRAVVYQRAKMVLDKRPFGTQEDVYREGYEWMHHSVAPKTSTGEKFRVTIGGPDLFARLEETFSGRAIDPGNPSGRAAGVSRATELVRRQFSARISDDPMCRKRTRAPKVLELACGGVRVVVEAALDSTDDDHIEQLRGELELIEARLEELAVTRTNWLGRDRRRES